MSINRWTDKEAVVHMYNGILLSHKKECIWVSSNEVNEPRAYYVECISQKEKNKYWIVTHIYERWYWWTCLLGSNEDAHTERFMDTGVWEEGEGGTNGESNWETYTLSCIKWIAHGHLLYDSGNSNRGSFTFLKTGTNWHWQDCFFCGSLCF